MHVHGGYGQGKWHLTGLRTGQWTARETFGSLPAEDWVLRSKAPMKTGRGKCSVYNSKACSLAGSSTPLPNHPSAQRIQALYNVPSLSQHLVFLLDIQIFIECLSRACTVRRQEILQLAAQTPLLDLRDSPSPPGKHLESEHPAFRLSTAPSPALDSANI